MLIGIISDSHDHQDHVRQAVAYFQQRGVVRVFHAGDHVNPGSVRLFAGLPLTGVLGNNDHDTLHLARAYDAIGGELLGKFGVVEVAGRRIALQHGDAPPMLETLAAQYDVVIRGHSHRWEHRQHGPALVLNPGTAHGFGKTATIMIHDLASGRGECIEL